MSGGRESPATKHLGKAPKGRLRRADPGPLAARDGGRKSPRTAPGTPAPPTLPFQSILAPRTSFPRGNCKAVRKASASPGRSDPGRFPSPGAPATLRAVHNSESPRTRCPRPHLPPPGPAPRLPARRGAGVPGSAAHRRPQPSPGRGPRRGSEGGLGLPPRPGTDLLLLPRSAASSLLGRGGGRLSLG